MYAEAIRGQISQKRLTLIAVVMGSFVVGVDATVINVALPTIEHDLGGGLAGQQWVVDAYLLTLGSLLLVGGSLGDVFGERRVFVLGVAGFGVFSAICALAPTIEVLVAARALQGVAGALLTPAALAVIVAAFSIDERGGAIGTWTAWSGIATVVGPLAGGYLIDLASWRWIFAINIPFVLATLVLSRDIPSLGEAARERKVDVLGGLLCALGLAGPVFALIEQPRLGWSDPGVYVSLIAGLPLFASFLYYERRTQQPMLPLALFKRRNFSFGNLETLSMYAGLGALFFFLVIFLQQVAGYSALESGLATLPATVVMFLLSRRFGQLADRYGSRLFMGVGPLVAASGLGLMLVMIDTDVSYAAEVLPGLLLFSLGLAMTVAPLTATVLADADQHNAGVASGTNNAIARVASLLAVSALGAVIAAQFASSLDARLPSGSLSAPARAAVEQGKLRSLGRIDSPRVPPPQRSELERASADASLAAFRLGLGIAAGLVALGGLVGIVGIRDRRRVVRAEECPGGAIVGAPEEIARERLASEPVTA